MPNQTPHPAEITVEYEGDDVYIVVTDPDDLIDSPPMLDLHIVEYDARSLEDALRKARLRSLALEEHLITVHEVQIGDIIGDLGFTVTKVDRLISRFGEDAPVMLWSDRDSLTMHGGREIKVSRILQVPDFPPTDSVHEALDRLRQQHDQ